VIVRDLQTLHELQVQGVSSDSPTRSASGRFLEQQRPAQVAFLKKMIEKTKDPQVKVRLERALKPWSLWNKEPRFWAFPEFTDSK